ncbi:MAG: tRNA lysidine(34) synthetase TilS [Candidatus Dependentiae bacterium]|nr:tRNA lysidine(34) synthetase TilS [Candidatus Dependentiae bacterium]
MQKISTRRCPAAGDLHARVLDFCDEHQLLASGTTVITGLSGGPDSTFLLHLLVRVREGRNLRLIAAHLDHGWRERSREDAAFCKEQAEALRVPFVQGHARDFLPPTEGQIKVSEAAGRAARRSFFEQLAREEEAHAIALAHQADEQLETFFVRLLRGSGVTGLAGIRARQGAYIHPLLPLRKAAMLAWLEEEKIPYLTDPSNGELRFLRNRIRHGLVPALQAADHRFEASLARTMALLGDADEYIAREVRAHLLALLTTDGNRRLLDIKKLFTLHPFLRDQVVLSWLIEGQVPFTPSRDFVAEVIRFLATGRGGTHTLYGSWRIVKKQCYACIERCGPGI